MRTPSFFSWCSISSVVSLSRSSTDSVISSSSLCAERPDAASALTAVCTRFSFLNWIGETLTAEPVAESTMDTIAKGATAGMTLLLNMIAMLIVFVALVHLVNAVLGLLPMLGGEPVTLQRILGLVMAPVCWLIGIPWAQAVTAGSLMGIKTVLNELIAYLEMAKLPTDAIDPRSRLIMLYAMCGFANFGSVGIMIGGLTVMAPERRSAGAAERRSDVISLGMKSIVSGTLATLLIGAIVGLLN
ncbi:MAG: hypothetical protein EXQ83_15960 [Xanthobacteraceae bacterium]|nr:hypothetical protein [Xanthobacteraceae bacterium]